MWGVREDNSIDNITYERKDDSVYVANLGHLRVIEAVFYGVAQMVLRLYAGVIYKVIEMVELHPISSENSVGFTRCDLQIVCYRLNLNKIIIITTSSILNESRSTHIPPVGREHRLITGYLVTAIPHKELGQHPLITQSVCSAVRSISLNFAS